MLPSQNLALRQTNGIVLQSRQSTRNTEAMAQSAGVPRRLRNDESWVDISSQPSSSSLSSINDDIVVTGLRDQHDPNSRRRRRPHASLPSHINLEQRQTGTSSQEEYEESESEEDGVMTSSNEHIPTRLPTLSHHQCDAGLDSDDDDENTTALGQRTNAGETAFSPQPNAFSHPPFSHIHRPAPSGSYFTPQRGTVNERPNYISRSTSRNVRQSPSNNYAADHDAALRASLTTLLSIGAAAARGLPKRDGTSMGQARTVTEPMGLRFVPESELGIIPANSSRPLSPSTRARLSPSISSQETFEQGKRKASAASKSAGEKSKLKKRRMQAVEEEAMISPTLLAWVVSAGVIVLVSVVGFGAGYVIGREVGRQEAMELTGWNGSLGEGGCGRELVKGSTGSLRKFRWGIGGSGRSIVA